VLNAAAIDIGASSRDIYAQMKRKKRLASFKEIILRNVDISNVTRDGFGKSCGLHTDFIHIQGATIWPALPSYATKLTLDNVSLHDGHGALPLIINNGSYSSIDLHRVSMTNIDSGGLQVRGEPTGKIGEITVANSPGIYLVIFGANIDRVVFQDRRGEPTSEGATVGLTDFTSALPQCCFRIPGTKHRSARTKCIDWPKGGHCSLESFR